MAGRRPVKEAPARGVTFPLVNGSRSTTSTGRAVFAAAAAAIDPALAQAIDDEPAWHTGYLRHTRALVARQAAAPDAAVAVAEAGLAAVHERFGFAVEGDRIALAEAVEREPDGEMSTVTVQGSGDGDLGRLRVPYDGNLLEGDVLHRQLDDWLARGIVEPSFARAIRAVMAHPEWLDLSDHRVVVLGAGAEMGPLQALCGWNANVFAVDIARQRVWERIIRTARAGSGRVHIPVPAAAPIPADDAAIADVAGVDVITDLPALSAWLQTVPGPVTIGNYIYADGATHVRSTVAVDALLRRIMTRRQDVAVAVLATPTEVYAVPDEVVATARQGFAERSLLRRALGIASARRAFAPGYPETVTDPQGRVLGLADCTVAQQGPNYALAKRIQRWRALAARAAGHTSSVNVAPATGTRSVTKNRVLAAAYHGAPHFDVEVFAPETANMLMAAMLVHDLRAQETVSRPDTELEHPLALFWEGAAHGGLWRQPYAARSVLPLAAVRGWRALLG